MTGSLVERSRSALLERWPGLAATLLQPVVTRPILADGVVVDLELGGGRFYHGDGRAIAESQIDDFVATPSRLVVSRPDLSGQDQVQTLGSRISRLLLDGFRDVGLDPMLLPEAPTLTGNLVMVFGIGVGHVLPSLVRRLRPSELIIVETEGEFLRQSLAAIDWQEMLADCAARDCAVTLLMGQDAGAISDKIIVQLGAWDGPLIDGALIFTHYNNQVLIQAAARVRELAHLCFVTRGFFEDEKIMLRNCWSNLTAGPRPLLEMAPRVARSETALIVGAGPSLDKELSELRRLAPGMIVFTCGTALRICLAQGIRPDYHCENENVAVIVPILQEAQDSFGLSDLSLIAAITVDPLVPPLFADVTHYYGEASVSTKIFATPNQELVYATPMGANAAASAAVAMGFRRLIFFGVDCGSRQPKRRHADGTAYQILDELIPGEQSQQFQIS